VKFLEVKVGDKVLIPKMGAQTITLEGEEYYITQQNQIIAILEE
jgi:co-chaperonin GroES (HSP10)